MARKRKWSAAATGAASSGPVRPWVFEEGAEVELRYDDDGFRGAWFEAVVVQPLPGRRRAYSVVHSSLVADEDPSLRLTEVVSASHIRPRPPRFPAAAAFSLHQLVDAFHNGGWWAGVVSSALSPDRYTVCFPTSREEVRFPSADIRPHARWARLRWSFSGDKEGAGAKYEVGAEVEISGDREKYGAVWVPGTVEKVITKKIFVVEYRKVRKDGGIDLVKEIVDVQYIRPRPPRSSGAEKLKRLDVVEVFYHGGWTLGEVVKVLDGSKYVVNMEYPKEKKMKFHHSELRICRRLTDTVWHNVSKRKRGRRLSHAGRKQRLPLSVSTSPSSDDNSEATGQPLENEMSSKRKKEEGSNCEDNEVMSHSCKVLMKEGSSDQLWMELGPSTPMVNKEIAVINPDLESPSNELIASSPFMVLGLPQNPFSRELCNRQTLPTFTSRNELIGNDKALKFMFVGSEQQLRAPNFSHSLLGTINNDFLLENYKGVHRARLSTKRRKNLAIRGSSGPGEVPYIDAGQHAKEYVIKGKYSPPKKRSVNHTMVQIEGVELQHAKIDVIKRKCSPPKKRSVNHIMAQIDGVELQQSYGSSDPVIECQKRREDTDASNQADTVSMFNDIQPLCLQDKIMWYENSTSTVDIDGDSSDNDVFSTQTNEPETIAATHTSTTQKESSAQDNASAKYLATPSLTKVLLSSIDTGGQEISNIGNWFSDKGIKPKNLALLSPFKKRCGLTSSSFTIRLHDTSSDGDGFKADGSEVEDVALVSPFSNFTQSPSKSPLDTSPTHSSLVKAVLPFAKTSCLWESIESMEVFHLMPQQPHFRLLEQYSVEFREGMAIGLMVTFASLVANVSKFRISDSRGNFEEKLKALVPLEDNGFDVLRIRSRLEELLECRNSQWQSLGEKATLRGQIIERENEKDRLDALTLDLDKTIREVEQQLACLYEKRDLAVTQRKSCESEIARLQKDAAVVEEDNLSAEKHFNTLIASSWQ